MPRRVQHIYGGWGRREIVGSMKKEVRCRLAEACAECVRGRDSRRKRDRELNVKATPWRRCPETPPGNVPAFQVATPARFVLSPRSSQRAQCRTDATATSTNCIKHAKSVMSTTQRVGFMLGMNSMKAGVTGIEEVHPQCRRNTTKPFSAHVRLKR